jgi:hypothetical protein
LIYRPSSRAIEVEETHIAHLSRRGSHLLLDNYQRVNESGSMGELPAASVPHTDLHSGVLCADGLFVDLAHGRRG